MHAYQIVAYILNDSEQKQSDMKKIVIVDGGREKKFRLFLSLFLNYA